MKLYAVATTIKTAETFKPQGTNNGQMNQDLNNETSNPVISLCGYEHGLCSKSNASGNSISIQFMYDGHHILIPCPCNCCTWDSLLRIIHWIVNSNNFILLLWVFQCYSPSESVTRDKFHKNWLQPQKPTSVWTMCCIRLVQAPCQTTFDSLMVAAKIHTHKSQTWMPSHLSKLGSLALVHLSYAKKI